MDAKIEARLYENDGRTPNNPRLPLVIVRGCGAAAADDPAAWLEEKFIAHGWSGVWRWGVYPYQHFHPNNHEVLGVSRGHGRLMLGGENGEEYEFAIGDVIVIPAGVGHMGMENSKDFQVVGAYPGGKEPDLIRAGQGFIPAALKRIGEVPLPEQDPVFGPGGPLFEHWRTGVARGRSARRCGRQRERGRNAAFAPLPPPKRACGSPANGSPVNGLLRHGGSRFQFSRTSRSQNSQNFSK